MFSSLRTRILLIALALILSGGVRVSWAQERTPQQERVDRAIVQRPAVFGPRAAALRGLADRCLRRIHRGHVAGGDGLSRGGPRSRRRALWRENHRGHRVGPRSSTPGWNVGGPAGEPRPDVQPRHQHADARRGHRHGRKTPGRAVPKSFGAGGRVHHQSPGSPQSPQPRRRLAILPRQSRTAI